MGQTDSSRTEIVWSAEARPLSKIAARALGKVRKPAKPDRDQDLSTEEPTERADVPTGDEEFEERLKKLLEKLLEDASFEVKVPFITIRTGVKTPARSPMSRAATAFLLTIAGCMCSAVLHAIGAPQWAQLIGLLLPWAIALSQAPFRRGTGTDGRVA
jgi:hypothetical protein